MSHKAAAVLVQLRRLLQAQQTRHSEDVHLLELFLHRRDEDAFAELVRRHGPLVLGVCRRVLRNPHDADDVFQATFLVFARKAESIRKHASLPSWLHGVAYRLSLKCRAGTRRRREHEQPFLDHEQATRDDVSRWELRAVLDEELRRLPEQQRVPLLLCYAEGKSQDEAARELGWSRGTLKRRLERGREILRTRLTRRGLALSAGAAAVLTQPDLLAAVPPTLTATTAKLAALMTAPEVVAATAVSAKAALLAEGMMKSMVLGKVKTAAAVMLMLGLLGTGAGVVAHQTLAPRSTEARKDAATQTTKSAKPKQAEHIAARLDANGDPLPEGAISRLGTTRLRHGGLTTAVAFAPDGKSLLTMGVDGLRAWDVATGRPLHRLANQAGRDLNPGILSADGKQVVTVDLNTDGKRLRLLEVATGRLVREFGDHPCIAACFSPNGSVLATFGTCQPDDPRYRDFANVTSVWDLATGQRMNSWTGHKDGVYCGLFLADGKTLITSGGDKAIRFWDVATAREVRQMHGKPAAVGHFALSPDGTLLAAVGLRDKPAGVIFPSGLAWYADNSIRIWDLSTGKEVQHLTVPRPEQRGVSGFTAAAFTPDGKAIVTGGVDQFARLWDLATGKELRRYDFGHQALWALALSPDGKTLAGLTGGRTVRLIDTASGKDLLPQVGHRTNVLWNILTPDNKTAITAGGGDAAIRIWDLPSGQERHRLEGHEKLLAGVLAAGDGRTLYSIGYGDGIIVVWDLLTRKPLRRLPQLPALKSPPHVTALSPDGTTLALGALTTVFLIDTATGTEKHQLEGPAGGFYQVAFSPDGRTLTVFCYDRSVQLWGTASGAKLRQLLPPGTMLLQGAFRPSGLNAAVLSPDGKLVAYVKDNRCPALFELATGKPVHSEVTPAEGVSVFAFSPDSRMLAWSGLREPVIHVMEVTTGKERLQLAGHRGRVASLSFSADAQMLISGSEDTTALVWDLTGRLTANSSWGKALSQAKLEASWCDLAGDDAAKAYRTIRRLAASPTQAIPYLRTRLQPAPSVDEKQVARWIADLDSDDFKKRAKASRELERLEESVAGLYRKVLEDKPSAEVKSRVAALLEKHTNAWVDPNPERLRILRALEVLELAATAEARQVLEALAKGAPGAGLTVNAKAALDRLAKAAAAP